MLKNIIFFLLLNTHSFYLFSQENINVEGIIIDTDNEALPYTAVSILSKYIGTVSNDDGAFPSKA